MSKRLWVVVLVALCVEPTLASTAQTAPLIALLQGAQGDGRGSNDAKATISQQCEFTKHVPLFRAFGRLPALKSPLAAKLKTIVQQNPTAMSKVLAFAQQAPLALLHIHTRHHAAPHASAVDHLFQALYQEELVTALKPLMPTNDPALVNGDTPGIFSSYTLYMLAYCMGWVGFTQVVMLTTEAVSSPTSSERTARLTVSYAILFVIAQYLYGLLMIFFSRDKPDLCRVPKPMWSLILGHLGLALLGLVDPTPPKSYLPIIKAYKLEMVKQQPQLFDGSEVEVARPFDDIRAAIYTARTIPVMGPAVSLLDLAMRKPISRAGLGSFLAHGALLALLCATGDGVTVSQSD